MIRITSLISNVFTSVNFHKRELSQTWFSLTWIFTKVIYHKYDFHRRDFSQTWVYTDVIFSQTWNSQSWHKHAFSHTCIFTNMSFHKRRNIETCMYSYTKGRGGRGDPKCQMFSQELWPPKTPHTITTRGFSGYALTIFDFGPIGYRFRTSLP